MVEGQEYTIFPRGDNARTRYLMQLFRNLSRGFWRRFPSCDNVWLRILRVH